MTKELKALNLIAWACPQLNFELSKYYSQISVNNNNNDKFFSFQEAKSMLINGFGWNGDGVKQKAPLQFSFIKTSLLNKSQIFYVNSFKLHLEGNSIQLKSLLVAEAHAEIIQFYSIQQIK